MATTRDLPPVTLSSAFLRAAARRLDLTTGTGRFNLARGTVGALSGVAAAVSTIVSGYAYQRFGHLTGFLVIAAIAASATALLWYSQQETKPEKYVD